MTRLAIRRPVTISVIFIALILFGFISYNRLPIDLLPDITLPVCMIVTPYPGAGPLEVERLVTKPIENGVATVPNLKHIESTSSENVSFITLTFDWGTDLDVAVSDVREKIDIVLSDLPAEAERPFLFKFSTEMVPVVVIGVKGNLSSQRLYDYVEDLKDRLQRLPGVGSVFEIGGFDHEIQVRLNSRLMEAAGIDPQNLIGALKAQNLNFPLGDFKKGRKQYLLRLVGEFDRIEEIGNIVVGRKGDHPILLSEVATVTDTFLPPDGFSRFGGSRAITLLVQKKSKGNTVEIADRVKEALEEIRPPKGIEQQILMDISDYTKESVRGVFSALIKGAILVFLILLFFLRDIRPTLIVSLSMPISIFIAFFLMNSAGLTMNIISIGGLTLAVGMIVDNAIVVLENIFRHRERGEDARTATIEGTREVGSAVVASTITTIAVFLPLVFTTGIANIFFKEMAFTVTVALIASLAVALSLIPMVASRALAGIGAISGRIYQVSKRFFDYIDERYVGFINWALGNKPVVYSFTIILFIISLSLLFTGRVGTEFMPMADSGEISFMVELPRGTRAEISEAVSQRIEKEIIDLVPELKVMRSQTGGGFAWITGGAGDPSIIEFHLRLVSLEKRRRSTKEIEDILRDRLNGLIPGTRITFGTTSPVEAQFIGGRPIVVEIVGENLELTSAFADSVAELMRRIKGCVDIDISRKTGKVEYALKIDHQKAALYGLSAYQIGSQLRSRFEGMVATTYRKEGNEFDVRILARDADYNDLDKIKGINIQSPMGPVPLINLVTLKKELGPVDIERKDRSRVVKVSCNLSGRTLGSVLGELERGLARIPMPPGVEYRITGSAEQMGESFRDLRTILIIAVILVYLVMAAQFESLGDPFVIILSVPLAVIGALWMLFFTNTTFNIESFLGIIMLSGIVVNNAIVYVTYTKILRERGMGLTEAVVESGRTRLRPILMTAFTTIFGLIPMAIGYGAGAEMRYPLARAVIGGLLVATFLTLIFIPTFYHTFHRREA